MTEPEPAAPVPSKRTRRLIWGTAILLAALLLGVTGAWVLSSWYIQKNNEAWCRLYDSVTHKVLITDNALYVELTKAKEQQGC